MRLSDVGRLLSVQSLQAVAELQIALREDPRILICPVDCPVLIVLLWIEKTLLLVHHVLQIADAVVVLLHARCKLLKNASRVRKSGNGRHAGVDAHAGPF